MVKVVEGVKVLAEGGHRPSGAGALFIKKINSATGTHFKQETAEETVGKEFSQFPPVKIPQNCDWTNAISNTI